MNIKKNLLVAALVIVLLGIAGAVAYSLQSKTPVLSEDAKKNAQEQEEQAVRELVTNFGKQLQKVSLAGPQDVVAKEIQDNYAPFVSPDILKFWMASTTAAPGRLTSSPWPDRIEIQHLEPAQNGDGAYDVAGYVIEVTSVEAANGGMASKYQVFLKIRNQNDRWVITGYQAVQLI